MWPPTRVDIVGGKEYSRRESITAYACSPEQSRCSGAKTARSALTGPWSVIVNISAPNLEQRIGVIARSKVAGQYDDTVHKHRCMFVSSWSGVMLCWRYARQYAVR